MEQFKQELKALLSKYPDIRLISIELSTIVRSEEFLKDSRYQDSLPPVMSGTAFIRNEETQNAAEQTIAALKSRAGIKTHEG